MNESIPFVEEPRPDTGVTNGAIGVGLFLASEVMFFGALLTAYTLLRLSAPSWAFHLSGQGWDAGIATILLFGAGFSLSRALGGKVSRKAFSASMAVTTVLAIGFLIAKGAALSQIWNEAVLPSQSTANGLYYAFSGVHALHVVGGAVWSGILFIQALGTNPILGIDSQRRRARLLLAYWVFLDLIWVAILLLFYLL